MITTGKSKPEENRGAETCGFQGWKGEQEAGPKSIESARLAAASVLTVETREANRRRASQPQASHDRGKRKGPLDHNAPSPPPCPEDQVLAKCVGGSRVAHFMRLRQKILQ